MVSMLVEFWSSEELHVCNSSELKLNIPSFGHVECSLGAEAAPSTHGSELESAVSLQQRSPCPSAEPVSPETYRLHMQSSCMPSSKQELLMQMGDRKMRANNQGPAISGDKTLEMYTDDQFATVRLSFLALYFLPKVVVVRSRMRHGPSTTVAVAPLSLCVAHQSV